MDGGRKATFLVTKNGTSRRTRSICVPRCPKRARRVSVTPGMCFGKCDGCGAYRELCEATREDGSVTYLCRDCAAKLFRGE